MNISKVILFGLMVFSVLVNADKKQEGRRQLRRESACARACRILGAPLFFLGGAISSSLSAFSFYQAYQAQAQMPKVVCSAGSNRVILYAIADACDKKVVSPLMKNGILRNDGQCYLDAQNSRYPLPAPQETLPGLAKTGRRRALKKGDYRLAETCLLYDANNN